MFGFLLSGSWLQTSLVAVVVGMLVYWYIQKRKYKLPPGPMALPLIGNLLQPNKSVDLWSANGVTHTQNKLKDPMMHEQVYNDWAKKYGPVVSVYLGPMLVVFVNNIDTALEVLVKRSTDFASRMSLPSIDVFTQGGKDIAFGAYGPTWKLHRKIASKALRQYMLGQALEERVHSCLENALVELEKQKEPFDPKEYVNYIVGNLLTGLCFGEQYGFGDKEANTMMEKTDSLNETFNSLTPEDIFPPIRYVYKSKTMKAVEVFTEEIITGFIERKFREHEKSFDKDNIRHFTDSLILARQEAEEEEGSTSLESLTDTHLIQTLADIYFAGTDTTRLTLRFAILHMISLPDIQTKVQEEIDRVVGQDRLPCISDRPNLGYTEAVLHESMRLFTVAPMGVFHQTTCDTEVGGYQVPKDTMVAINHWALHNDPDAWDQVDKFIPERYLDEDGKLGPKPKSWLPFSAGKRVCLGEFVAKPEIHLVFASLMQKFKWKPEPGVILDMKIGGSSFGVMPKPYNVVLEKRF